MAGEKPSAPVKVLWGLFKFIFLSSFYESVKVFKVVYKVVYTELHLVTAKTDKEESEMLRLYDALIWDISIRISQYIFSFTLTYD